MSKLTIQFEQRLQIIQQTAIKQSLTGIRRGVERETLRVNGDGSLAIKPHPKALGSALSHEWITTDFSESLLEFITPPERNAATTIEQLIDIHASELDKPAGIQSGQNADASAQLADMLKRQEFIDETLLRKLVSELHFSESEKQTLIVLIEALRYDQALSMLSH